MAYKIILIEDELDTAAFVKEYLDNCGFDIDVFTTITDATINIKLGNYDFIYLI